MTSVLERNEDDGNVSKDNVRSKGTAFLLATIILISSFSAVLFLSGSISVEGDDEFEHEGINYHITGDDAVEVTYGDYSGNIVIPEYVDGPDDITYRVISIGYYAFQGCTGLTTIDLGSVTYISYGAFYGCTGLTTIDLGSVTYIDGDAFYGCTSLTKIDLGSVTYIGEYAFEGCTGLTAIDLGSVTYIDRYAFQGCTGLTTIDLGSVTYISYGAFDGCTGLTTIDLGSVTEIGRYAFAGCTGLTTVTIPASVENIGYGPFADCINLQEIIVEDGNANYSSVDGVLFNADGTVLIQYPVGNEALSYDVPEEVETIGDSAFQGCTGLTTIDLGLVETIGDWGFAGCTGLTTIDLGSIETIGNYAFQGCTGLTTINLGSVTYISYGAFDGCTGLTTIDLGSVTYIGGDAFYGCTSLTTIDLGSVTYIGGGAFDGCTGLTTIDLGSVTYIGGGAFAGCTGLTTIDLGSVTYIGGDAFYGCTSLTTIDLDSVTEIGDYAFAGCTGLTTVTIPASVENIGYGPFADCINLQEIIVEDGNANYSSVDGVLFNVDGTVLIQYPVGNEALSYDVPEEVETIGDSAFAGCTGLTTIDLGSVTYIGYYAFQGCTGLTTIDLGSIETIGNYAFQGCTGLTTINLSSVTYIGSGAFAGCIGLTTITMPASVTYIGNGPFAGCINLKEMIVEEGNANYSSDGVALFNADGTILIQYPVGNDATSYEIPASVTYIGDGALTYCINLQEIIVEDGNVNYSSVDGVLFNYDKTELVQYPAGNDATSYEIPASVTEIGYGALTYCINLQEIIVEDGNVNYSSDGVALFNADGTILIQYPAGNDATNYEIPASVIYINGNAFQGCTELKVTVLPYFTYFESDSFPVDTLLLRNHNTDVTVHAVMNDDGNIEMTVDAGEGMTATEINVTYAGGKIEVTRSGEKWIFTPVSGVKEFSLDILTGEDTGESGVSEGDDGFWSTTNVMIVVGIVAAAVVALLYVFVIRRP